MSVTEKTKTFFIKSKRVWHALRKPTRKEYSLTAKISSIGILILGAIGFIISLIMKVFA